MPSSKIINDISQDKLLKLLTKNIINQAVLVELIEYLEGELDDANSALFEIERAASSLQHQINQFSKEVEKFRGTLG